MKANNLFESSHCSSFNTDQEFKENEVIELNDSDLYACNSLTPMS